MDYLTELELILYVELGLEKYSNYLTAFFSVINFVQRNSPNTVKSNFPRSDIVWFENPNVNVVK